MRILYTLGLAAALLSSGATYAQAVDLDPTFGSNGLRLQEQFPTGYESVGYVLLEELSGGKVLAVGQIHSDNSLDDDIFLLRLNADGSPDASYNGDGWAVDSMRSEDVTPFAMTVLDNGEVLVGGIVGSGPMAMKIWKYNTNGEPVTTWGTGGYIEQTGWSFPVTEQIVEQADGKFLVAGRRGSQSTAFVRRYNADGSIDTHFGTAGTYEYIRPTGTSTTGIGRLILVSGGKILLAGSYDDGGQFDATEMLLMRLTADGVVDSTFGEDGIADLNKDGEGGVYDMVVLTDGKIVVAGSETNGGLNKPLFVKVTADGVRDSTFGVNSNLFINNKHNTLPRNLDVDDDGNLIAGISTFDGSGTWHQARLGIMRITPGGELDSAFANDGIDTVAWIIQPNRNNQPTYQDMLLMSDGRVLIAGLEKTGEGLGLARFLNGNAVGIGSISANENTVQMYPNPVQDKFNVKLHIAGNSSSTATLYNIYGQQVTQYWQNRTLAPGEYNETLQLPANCPTGQYLLQVQTAGETSVLKIMVSGK